MNAATVPTMSYVSQDRFCLKGLVPALRQFRTLLAKELCEARWLMLAGTVFLAIGPLEYAFWRESYSYNNGGAVGFIGILYAALVGIAASVRDLSPGRLDFWRSRAIGTGRFVCMKWLAGLLAAFLPALAMLALEAVLCHCRFQPDASHGGSNYDLARLMGNAVPLLTFALAAYALAFCIGSFLRRGVDAAILTATALLILWLLPLVLPLLAWLNVSTPPRRELVVIHWTGRFGLSEGEGFWIVPWLNWVVTYHPPYLRFATGMLLIVAACTLLSQFAIRRDWKIRMDRKLILWSLGGSVVLLVSSMLWAVRSNLEPTQELQLFAAPGRPCVVSQLIAAGDHVWAAGYDPASRAPDDQGDRCAAYLWPLQQRDARWTAGSPLSLGVMQPGGLTSNDFDRFLWSPLTPDLLYAIDKVERHVYKTENGQRILTSINDATWLRTFSLSQQGKLIDQTDLKPLLPEWGLYNAAVCNGRLLLASWKTALFFDPQPLAGPRLRVAADMDQGGWRFALERLEDTHTMFGASKPAFSLPYPSVSQLSPDDRLLAGLVLARNDRCRGFLEDNRLVCYQNRDLHTYDLTDIQDPYALFRPDASLEAYSMERVTHGTDPMVYGRQGRWYWHIDWGGGLTLYDLPLHAIRRAGHFNRPQDRFRTALVVRDHTLLVGGKKLYALPLPPSK